MIVMGRSNCKHISDKGPIPVIIAESEHDEEYSFPLVMKVRSVMSGASSGSDLKKADVYTKCWKCWIVCPRRRTNRKQLQNLQSSTLLNSQMSVSTAAKTNTFRSAVYQIQSKIKQTSPTGVHIYAFNVPEDQLKDAHKLLDKGAERRSMRVTYSLDHNFIIRHMPGRVHEETIQNWNIAFTDALRGLIMAPTEPGTPGCEPVGSTAFDLGQRKKQPDSGVRPTGSDYPSVVLEVGSSESLGQLCIDARLWIEHMDDVKLVVLISIDPPVFPNATPQITVLLWRPTNPVRLPCPTSNARQRIAQIVQRDDWTLNDTPVRILLSEIFGNQIPAAYAGHTHVDLNTQWLRQKIINSYP